MRTRVLLPLLFITCVIVPAASRAETRIKHVDAIADGDTVRIEVELTSLVMPMIQAMPQPTWLIIDFQNVLLDEQPRKLSVQNDGVKEVTVGVNHGSLPGTWIVVRLDSFMPYDIGVSGNKFVLTIRSHPGSGSVNYAKSASKPADIQPPSRSEFPNSALAASAVGAPLEVEHLPVASEIDDSSIESAVTVRHRFRVKYVTGNTAYIDGGSNSGLRTGMHLDIGRDDSSDVDAEHANDEKTRVASVHIVSIASTSAILEVGASNGEIQVGDWAELIPVDAATAARNALSGPENTLHAASTPLDDEPDSPRRANSPANSFRPAAGADAYSGTRMAGRIGFDYSGISSTGSTPGTSTQVGLSFQSDMKRILGTHWNLEGYWRGRINQHSQFQEQTIDDTLNKTYTMQLYYDNPNSKWVAGVGRLYLPWAVSLDTIDGGYFGRRSALGMTTGIFAGSTPDLTSWHYRPDQRIGGFFMNFEGGDYDRFHYSSTSGAGLTSIGWKLDRPFLFFENEASYKGTVSIYHSLIVDSPQGVTTDGIRPGAGVSHSYFTAHYQPKPSFSFDLYHNFFRDVPTATTAVVGTGLVDKLLFQGISGGVHLRPTRYFTLYSTLGASDKTGDSHRSLNQMFGGTWNEIPRTGIRADFRYSKFDSNFGKGDYQMLLLSRQLTNRMFWNIQFGNQDLLSQHTTNYTSKFVADSLDINVGRHSYLQSGYTFVDGVTLNYREWYLSWGYRFDQGKSNPQYVQTLESRH